MIQVGGEALCLTFLLAGSLAGCVGLASCELNTETQLANITEWHILIYHKETMQLSELVEFE